MLPDRTITALIQFSDRETQREKFKNTPIHRVLLKKVDDGKGNISLHAMPQENEGSFTDQFLHRGDYKLERVAEVLRLYDYSKISPENHAKVTQAITKINQKIDKHNKSFFVRFLSLFYDCTIPSLTTPTKGRIDPIPPRDPPEPVPPPQPGAATPPPPDLSIIPKKPRFAEAAEKKEVGYGITNSGNSCYVNSMVQALRLAPSFKENIDYHYKETKKDQKNLSPATQTLIGIAELPSAQKRNTWWTELMNIRADQSKTLYNELSAKINDLPLETKQLLHLCGVKEPERSSYFLLLKEGTPLELLEISPDLTLLARRLKAAFDTNKESETLKADLSTVFKDLKKVLEPAQFSTLINDLLQIQEQAKENTLKTLEKKFPTDQSQPPEKIRQNKAFIEFFRLSRPEQLECLRYPTIIELKNLYNTIEGTNNGKQETVQQDAIQSLRQLARFGGLDAKNATSQEDAAGFLSHIMDSLQMDIFAFNHTRGTITDLATFFSLGLGEEKFEEKITLQEIVSNTDRHTFSNEKEVPSLLPIQLKRYRYSEELGATKNKKPVIPSLTLDIPIQEGTKKTEKYHLAAIVLHVGETVQSGHYFTYEPRILNGKEVWVEYNDSTVQIHERPHSMPPDLALENGYIFLYKKAAE